MSVEDLQQARMRFAKDIQQQGRIAQLPRAPEVPIYPESEMKFFCEAADAQITFVTDGTVSATGLVFQHDGRDLRAQRVE